MKLQPMLHGSVMVSIQAYRGHHVGIFHVGVLISAFSLTIMFYFIQFSHVVCLIYLTFVLKHTQAERERVSHRFSSCHSISVVCSIRQILLLFIHVCCILFMFFCFVSLVFFFGTISLAACPIAYGEYLISPLFSSFEAFFLFYLQQLFSSVNVGHKIKCRRKFCCTKKAMNAQHRAPQKKITTNFVGRHFPETLWNIFYPCILIFVCQNSL